MIDVHLIIRGEDFDQIEVNLPFPAIPQVGHEIDLFQLLAFAKNDEYERFQWRDNAKVTRMYWTVESKKIVPVIFCEMS